MLEKQIMTNCMIKERVGEFNMRNDYRFEPELWVGY